MKEQLISFETAKLAKEKGFNNEGMTHSCNYLYASTGKLVSIGSNEFWSPDSTLICSAPTQSLLQKWLREKHNIQLFIFKQISCCWTWTIWGESASTCLDRFDTYEQALEKGLQEALKLI